MSLGQAIRLVVVIAIAWAPIAIVMVGLGRSGELADLFRQPTPVPSATATPILPRSPTPLVASPTAGPPAIVSGY
ncbi:MAG: hypothetical protein NZ518_02390, partial [Dehalococcoidia bacterium]|nr:hypothetical protein [Dehalococcoidia bacterium]